MSLRCRSRVSWCLFAMRWDAVCRGLARGRLPMTGTAVQGWREQGWPPSDDTYAYVKLGGHHAGMAR
jgi:hypothetical protein